MYHTLRLHLQETHPRALPTVRVVSQGHEMCHRPGRQNQNDKNGNSVGSRRVKTHHAVAPQKCTALPTGNLTLSASGDVPGCEQPPIAPEPMM